MEHLMTVFEWIREAIATVMFFALMAMVYVMLAVIFPDPTFWSPQ